MQQRNACRAVRIVFDGGNLGGNADLIPFEVNQAIGLLRSTTDEAAGDTAVRCAAARSLFPFNQGFLRPVFGDIVAGEKRLKAPRWRCWSKTLNRHGVFAFP